MYNYALSCEQQNKKNLTLKYTIVKNILSDTLMDKKILPQTISHNNIQRWIFPRLQYMQ